MLCAMGKASEQERVRTRCTFIDTDEDREKQVYRVEKVLLQSQVRGVASGYS